MLIKIGYLYAREYLELDNDRKDLEQILQDESSDSEMKILTEKELETLKKKKTTIQIN